MFHKLILSINLVLLSCTLAAINIIVFLSILLCPIGLFSQNNYDKYLNTAYKRMYSGHYELSKANYEAYKGMSGKSDPDIEYMLELVSNKVDRDAEQVTIVYSNGTYKGACANGKREGWGVLEYNDGGKYEGCWENDVQHGPGKYYYNDGDQFEGLYKTGRKEGKGTYYYSTGDKYVGYYKKNVMSGPGEFYYSNGDKYVGNFDNNRRNGEGTYYYSNGDKFVGYYLNDQPHGEGKYYFSNGDVRRGTWEYGRLLD